MTPFRSGFISIIGRTNVGKSTLVNQLMGEKLSIISDKPQTTRNRIHCILQREGFQAVFLDTPGIHSAKTRLGERMNRYALDTLSEVDLILFMTTADSKKPGPGDMNIIDKLVRVQTQIFLVLNKGDLVSETAVRELLESYQGLLNWTDTHSISALYGQGVPELTDAIFRALPEGPRYYDEDMIIDQPERFLAAEIIREKVLMLTRDEIPHGVAVNVESMKEITRQREEGCVDVVLHIDANIYTDRESPKGIIVGAKGAMLKQIGTLARADLEKLLGCHVFLNLWVRVRQDWRNNEYSLREFGYRKQGK